MIYNKLHFIPLIIFLWFPITFIITYIIAYFMHDINPLFPYISDTGTFSPESCIFGQLLNTGAILFGLFMYIRYRQVDLVCDKHHNGAWVRRCNRVCAWMGGIAALGISIVANFQESNILSVHMVGAGLAFGLGCIYAVLQAIISFRLYPNIGSKLANNTRVVLAVICCVSNLICTITGAISLSLFEGKDITKWSLDDGGYYPHLASTGSEWIVANGIMIYILTFYWEFKTIKLHPPQIDVQENPSPSNEQPNIRY